MPYWLFEILFWVVILLPVIWPVLFVIGVSKVAENLMSKPKKDTPEKQADDLARFTRAYARLQANGTPTVPLNVALKKFDELNSHQT